MGSYQYKTPPYEHQVRTLRASWNRKFWGLFAEMGLGKTKMLIDTAGALYEQDRIDGVLVTAPKGTYDVWPGEIDKHLPDRIERGVCLWSTSMRKAEQLNFERLFESSHALHFLIVNTEAIITSKGLEAIRRFLSTHRALWAFDESTKIKNHKSTVTKVVLRIAPQAHYRRIMSGLPNPQGPLDLFSQCEFLEPGALGGTSNFYAFRNRYALLRPMKVGPRRFNVVSGYTNLDELGQRLAAMSTRLRKGDCLDLPPKVYERRVYELPPEHRAIYDKMKKQALLELEGTSVTATLAITMMQKLSQIACGHIRMDDGSVVDLSSSRIDVLKELIEEAWTNEGKFLVWSAFRPDIEKIVAQLRDLYGSPVVDSYHGGTSQADRRSAVSRFQNPDDPLRILVCSQAAAYGLTLTQATTVIYYSNSYNLDVRVQSEDRAHRIGQYKSVLYMDIVADKTGDVKLTAALQKKLNVAQLVLDAPREWM